MTQTRFIRQLGVFLLAAAFFWGQRAVRADEIKLKNGDRLTGSVLSVADGRVHLRTTYAGDISFPWSEVVSLKTDHPLTVTLRNGTEETGWIEPSRASVLLLLAPSGTMKILPSQIAALRPPERETAARIAAAGKPPRWVSEIDAGLQAHSGTVNSQDFHMAFRTRRKARDSELSFRVSSDYARSGGERTAQRAFGEARLDRFYTRRYFSTYLLDLEHDAIQDLNLRATESAGVGYKFILTPLTLLQGDVGAGMIEEYFRDGSSNVDPIARLGGRWERRIGQSSKLKLSAAYLPILSHIRQYRLQGDSSFTTPITEQFQLRLSLVDRFNSNPQPNVKKNDLTFRSSVVWQF